jgi:predicted nucleic acid-binding protein
MSVHQLVSSEVLEAEVRSNPSAERRLEAMAILNFAVTRLTLDENSIRRAQVLSTSGYGPFDALHIAAAESGSVDVLFSTDDRLINKAARGLGHPRIQVRNPLSWTQESK